MEGGVGAAHRYLGENRQQQGEDGQVHADALASEALLNVLRQGDNLGRHRGEGLAFLGTMPSIQGRVPPNSSTSPLAHEVAVSLSRTSTAIRASIEAPP